MRKLSFFCAVFLCLWISADANGLPEEGWNVGEIVLSSGEKIKGEIQYDLDQNVAMIKHDGLVKAFSAYNIDHFRFLDTEMSMIRSFYTLPFQNGNEPERLMFFELIFEDGFAIFNRELEVSKKHAVLAQRPYVQNNEVEELVKISSYYIFTPDGNFQKVKTEESDLADKLSLGKQEKKEMRQFIYENELNLNYRSDFIKVIYEVVQNGAKT